MARLHGFWPKIVLKKWLNIGTRVSDFSADEDVDTESELDGEDGRGCAGEEHGGERRMSRLLSDVSTSGNSSFKHHRRRKSETTRAQYISTNELRLCVGTWNVGGKLPTEETDIEEWLGGAEEPADIYVIGLQEIVPLNAGNVLGAEDNRPIPRWESLIRETLNRIGRVKPKVKCHSDPPSPSRFRPSDDAPSIEDEMPSESESGSEGEEIHPFDAMFGDELDVESNLESKDGSENLQASKAENVHGLDTHENLYSSRKKLSRLCQFDRIDGDLNLEASDTLQRPSLARLLSNSERIGLTWPEKPLDLEPRSSLLSSKSFKSAEPFRCHSFKHLQGENMVPLPTVVPELRKLESMTKRRIRSPSFVKVISKQMVGIFLSVWVRRGLRKRIQNVKVSTVGVGVMGYMGNKGSIAVSMSVYQTHFCFICCHLSAGEKEGDELRRNADVQEISRRTFFRDDADAFSPKTIEDHERIVMLGDLNYRINLSYERTMELISKQEWPKLAKMDQLKHELKLDRVFKGLIEGDLNFPPTYKYEVNSLEYVGGDAKGSRRKPAWCDRILSSAKGIRLLSYERSELKLSDHRPVTATFISEVEVFCHKKLQRALTFTDAELEYDEGVPDAANRISIAYP